MPKKKLNPQKTNHATLAHARNVARKAIIGHARNRPRTAGKFACPCCGNGTRSYAISGAKKIHTSCTSPGCPAWMD